jgi:hypothetical protein
LVFDRGRQTGGLRQIVSLHAVRDRNFHDSRLLFFSSRPYTAYAILYRSTGMEQ